MQRSNLTWNVAPMIHAMSKEGGTQRMIDFITLLEHYEDVVLFGSLMLELIGMPVFGE
jgi:hypothetical protein